MRMIGGEDSVRGCAGRVISDEFCVIGGEDSVIGVKQVVIP